jgi:MFS family permease
MTATARVHRSALEFHNARLFVAGQALSNIGTFSQIVALSLLVLSLTESGVALGAVMAIQAVPMIALSPWAGAHLDRLPLRKVLLLTSVAGAAQAACMAVLSATGTISLPWVFGLSLMLGFVQVFDRPAAQAFLVELVPRDAVPSAVGFASSAQSIGRLGGPALAALLFASSGSTTVFAVNAVSYTAVLVALLLLRSSEMVPRVLHSSRRTGMATAIAFARRVPQVRDVLIANAVIGLLAFNFPTFLASMATLTFNQPGLFGIAESLNAATALLAAFLLARYLRRATLALVGLAAIALGSSLLWTALSPTPAVFLASMLYFGLVVVAYTTASQSLVQQYSPAEMGGRMMSLYTLGSMGTTPIGAVLVGLVIDHVSPPAAIGLGATSAIVSGAALLLRGVWGSDSARRPREISAPR